MAHIHNGIKILFIQKVAKKALSCQQTVLIRIKKSLLSPPGSGMDLTTFPFFDRSWQLNALQIFLFCFCKLKSAQVKKMVRNQYR
jgi:hypothetical protein